MEKEALSTLISQGFSIRAVAKTLNKSPASVRYWARKHGLRWTHLSIGAGYAPSSLPHKCGQCGETDPKKFYGHKRGICGACHNAYTLKLGQDKRLRAIRYSGGRCQLCGFDKYPCSLDFHHRDPNVKDSTYHSMRSWSWERILSEVNKCVLLCKNCHAAVHAGLLKLPFRA